MNKQMEKVNKWGELASFDTASRKYRRTIKRLARDYRQRSGSIFTSDSYYNGLITWETARAEMGLLSNHKDPRWGRFFVRFEDKQEKVSDHD